MNDRFGGSDLRSARILFVTGHLAKPALCDEVQRLAGRLGFTYDIVVPGVQVAALLHTRLLRKRLQVPRNTDCVVLPGWCQGDPEELSRFFGVPFERGPRDLRDLPEYFGLEKRAQVIPNEYSIEIIAEINHATRMSVECVLEQARSLAADGADVIDVGCVPGESCEHVSEIVEALCESGFRVSIDSFDQSEVEQAVGAGAELVLSCSRTEIEWLCELGTEVVAVPDHPADVRSLDDTIDRLVRKGTPFRADPILEPVGTGFAASVRRYMAFRDRYPDVPVMMGVGNVTELTEVDSAGVNMLLTAICQELNITSVLTTQVINWCRTAVAELNVARRLVRHAVEHHVVPKHMGGHLVMLRDPKVRNESPQSLDLLAAALTDSNFRIFSEPHAVHLMNRHGHWQGDDVFALFEQAVNALPESIDSGHAFYLGYELARAELARHLGKQYIQDEPMSWGLLGARNSSSAAHPTFADDDVSKE